MSQPGTHRIALTLTLAARPARIFQALLSPDDLRRWFCPHINTEPFKGGRYVFWGDESIASMYTEGNGGGPIYGLEPGRNLWFTWQVSEYETDVVYYVEPVAPGESRLQVVHQGMPANLLLMDFWHLRLFALRAYLEGREGPGWFLYLPQQMEEVKLSLVIHATPAEVFRALTNSEQVGQWLGTTATLDARVGGTYDLGWRDAEGYVAGAQEILEFIPERRMAYRWQMGNEVGAGDKVTWQFTREGNFTRVTLTHGPFSPDRDNRDYAQGWYQLLWALKYQIEEGKSPLKVLEGSWSL